MNHARITLSRAPGTEPGVIDRISVACPTGAMTFTNSLGWTFTAHRDGTPTLHLARDAVRVLAPANPDRVAVTFARTDFADALSHAIDAILEGMSDAERAADDAWDTDRAGEAYSALATMIDATDHYRARRDHFRRDLQTTS